MNREQRDKIISVKADTYELIKKLAKSEERTIRSIIDRALKLYLEDRESHTKMP
jgi:hypothetical protein